MPDGPNAASGFLTGQPAAWLATATLARRELVRFVRQRNRVLGAVGQPILFWLLFGAGLGASFQAPSWAGGMSYREYFFPGVLVLIVLFTAIFSTISIIEDRREGFLQSVLVAPIPRWSIVAGKVAGGTLLAVGEALLFLALCPFAGISISLVKFGLLVLVLFPVAFGLTALGFTIAWRMDSTQGFHAIMNLFLMPLWLLSGAFFPASGVPGWLAVVIAVNPLTYGLAAMRRILYWEKALPVGGEGLPGMAIALTVTLTFALTMFLAAIAVVSRRRHEG
jgi:ABC-2 type transport system permease protein